MALPINGNKTMKTRTYIHNSTPHHLVRDGNRVTAFQHNGSPSAPFQKVLDRTFPTVIAAKAFMHRPSL